MKISELTDNQLLEVVEQFSHTTWEENALIRKVAISEFGSDNQVFILGLAVKLLPILVAKTMPKFDGNSYSLGFLEYEFTLHHQFTDESRAKRYLDLLKLTGRDIDSNQYNSIKTYYPHLLN